MKCGAYKFSGGCDAEATHTCAHAHPTCTVHKSSCCVPIAPDSDRRPCDPPAYIYCDGEHPECEEWLRWFIS